MGRRKVPLTFGYQLLNREWEGQEAHCTSQSHEMELHLQASKSTTHGRRQAIVGDIYIAVTRAIIERYTLRREPTFTPPPMDEEASCRQRRDEGAMKKRQATLTSTGGPELPANLGRILAQPFRRGDAANRKNKHPQKTQAHHTHDRHVRQCPSLTNRHSSNNKRTRNTECRCCAFKQTLGRGKRSAFPTTE